MMFPYVAFNIIYVCKERATKFRQSLGISINVETTKHTPQHLYPKVS